MRSHLAALIFLLVPFTATAQIYNAESRNIFDTLDPLCNPTTASANGIIFCDGFEDGVFSPPGANPGASNDYWFAASSNGTGCVGCADPTGRNWAETNTGTINPNRANFGAAGTKSTMTQGWNRGIEPSHCLRAVNGDPKYCQTSGGNAAGAVKNVYVRLYFKLAGTTSTRCSAGYPNCPTFNWYTGSEGTNRNGVKFIEMRDGLDTGGISWVNVSTDFEPHGDLVFGALDQLDSPNGSNIGKVCADGEGYCRQHLGSLSWYDHRDEWIFLEYHIKKAGDNTSVLEMWMDACGRDGLGCSPAAKPNGPTKRVSVSNWDLYEFPPGYTVADAIYLNSWNQGTTDGEIQFDEIVVRDGDVLDRPIGFFGGPPPATDGTSGSTVTPPPPVLLP